MIFAGSYADLLTLLQGSSPPTETIFLSNLLLIGDQQTAVQNLGWTITSTYTGYPIATPTGIAQGSLEVQQLNLVGSSTQPLPSTIGQPVPTQVTMRQARLVLLSAGLLDTVNNAVNAAGTAAQITWEYATAIERQDPLLIQLMSVCGITSDQMDQMFIQAATL